MRRRVDVRSRVDEQEKIRLRRHDRRDAGPVDAGEHPQLHLRRGDERAGVAGRDERLGLAVGEQVACAGDGGILLAAQRIGGAVGHVDDLAGVVDRVALGQRGGNFQMGQLLADPRLVADENDLDVGVLLQRLDGAGHRAGGGEVPAHRIKSDLHADALSTAGRRGATPAAGGNYPSTVREMT